MEHFSISLIKQPFHLARFAENHVWPQSLAYLADIFSRINELNLSVQCLDMSVFSMKDKIESMTKKLQFW
jgi:hypothetical protein